MKFKIMCDKGDAGYDYDTETAEIKFNELLSQNYLPVAVDPDTGKNKNVKEFDPDIQELIWVPAIMGG